MRTRTTLLTASALVMAAGAAAADVTLSGVAEMGVAGSKDDSARFHTDVNVTFTMEGATDGGLTFGTAIDLSEVSNDNGTSPPMDAKGNVVDAATSQDDHHGGINIYVKGPFGNLNLGDTDGGFDWAMTEVDAVGHGSIRDNQEHGGFSGNAGLDGMHDGQILRYDIATGPFGFAVSAALDDDMDGLNGKTPGAGDGSAVIGLGATYSMAVPIGTISVGFGYQQGEDILGKPMASLQNNNLNARALNAAMNDFKAPLSLRLPDVAENYVNDEAGRNEQKASTFAVGTKKDSSIAGGSVMVDLTSGLKAVANYSREDHEYSGKNVAATPANATGKTETTHIGLGIGYTFGQTAVAANWGNKNIEETYSSTSSTPINRMREKDVTGIGFTVTHDLGGGATLQFGAGADTTDTSKFADGNTTANRNMGDKKNNSWSLGLAFKF